MTSSISLLILVLVFVVVGVRSKTDGDSPELKHLVRDIDVDVAYCNATECSECVQQNWFTNSSTTPRYCGWCVGGNKCRAGTLNGPTTGSCAQWEYFGANFNPTGGSCCFERDTCVECNEVNNDYCGWCVEETSATSYCTNTKSSDVCTANATNCCGITDCGQCQAEEKCGWCPDGTGSCVPLAISNSTTPANGTCSTDLVDNCCSLSTTCQTCNAQSICFWCPTASASPEGACLVSATEKDKCIDPADAGCCATQADCSSCNSIDCSWCMIDSTCLPNENVQSSCSQVADSSCCSLNDDCYSCIQDECQWCAYHSLCYDQPYSCDGQPLIEDPYLCNRTIVVECQAALTCSDCVANGECIWISGSEIEGLPNNQEFCYSGNFFGITNERKPLTATQWYWKSCKVTGVGLWIICASCLGVLFIGLLALASFWFYKYLMRRAVAMDEWQETPRGDDDEAFFDSYKERSKTTDALIIAEPQINAKKSRRKNYEKVSLLT